MRRALALIVLLLLSLGALPGCGHHAAANGDETKLAPGFAGATAWLNVDHALTLEELRGKVVVVDFWTSCCINCIHTLPVLAEVEKTFAGKPVVVIGVHSAKFEVEKEADRLREIVAEYSIAHPIAVDGSMKLWNAWGVQGWPTVVVLDAAGHIVSSVTGETDRATLERAVQKALDDGAKAGTLVAKPLAGLRREVDHSGPLAFPGKVIALADGSLAISDTGHNRIVVVTADGAVESVVGSGLAGLTDGGFAEASFRKPQGLAESGDLLYVADTENHAIRVVDRHARTVATVAGTGELGVAPLDAAPTPARTTKLRSPWDLVQAGGALYVALAGSHQIALLNVRDGTISAFAGDGKERRLDGAGMVSSFAQPSGLTTDGKSLFVADAETSSIRAVSLATRDVHTLVGQDLFVFGDVDGAAPVVRLEHPLGVAWGAGAVWVADTYNSKIKRFDLTTGVMRTVCGGRDHRDLFEPEGLFFRGNDLVVADTKHHRIEQVDTKTGALHALEIRGLVAPSVGVALDVPRPDRQPSTAVEALSLGDVPLASHGATIVHFGWKTVPGTGINEEAPFHVEWTSSDGLASVPTPIKSTGATVQHGFDLAVTPIQGAEGGRLAGRLDVVLCDVTTHLVCVPVRRTIELTFRVATTPGESPTVLIPLPEAKP
jgi:thiol-disulfide isomerase/thioredoxin/energy-converting hydrogenase Eha subunit A